MDHLGPGAARPGCSSATTRTSAPTAAPGRGAGSSSTGCSPGSSPGLTAAVLLLAIKALFFYADNGFRDPGLGGPISCRVGAECVYQRYLDDGRGPEFVAAGVTDAGSFTRFYWSEQFGSAGTILVLTTLGGAGGAALYGVFRPKAAAPAGAGAGTAAGSGPGPVPG